MHTRRDLADTNMFYGDMLFKQRDLAGAGAQLTKALTMAQEIVNSDAKNLEARHTLVLCMKKLGDILIAEQ